MRLPDMNGWRRLDLHLDGFADSEIHGIVSLIASEPFAKNPPPRRIGKPSNMVRNMDIWKSGYLDIWIFGYLDSGKNSLLLHPQSGFLCGAAVPGPFIFTEKAGSWCVAT